MKKDIINYKEILDKDYTALIFSILLHLLFFLLAYFGVPNFSNKIVEEIVISLDALPVSNISNIKTQTEQKKTETIEETKSNKDVPISQKKLETETDDKKTKEDKVKEEEKVKEEKKEEPKKEIKEDPKKDEEVIPKEKIEEKIIEKEVKPKPKENKPALKEKPEIKKKDKTNEFSELDSLLKTLEAPKTKNTDENVKKTDQTSQVNDQKKATGKYNDSLPLSISEKDTIGNQIYKAWYFQAGAKDTKDMYVVLRVTLNIEGVVENIEIIETSKNTKSSSAYKVFTDSAIRAVKKASPFQGLSKERYRSWRELELNFDPRGVIF